MYTATGELHRCFKHLNHHFFGGQLPEPTITIQTKGKRNAFGWCSAVEIWKNQDESVKKYEINITAEDLDRGVVEVMQTLLHEMIHLHNVINGVKDSSRNGTFHNKKFKNAAERFGMIYKNEEADKRYGWAFPVLAPATIELIETLNINEKAFELARRVPKTTKKSNSYKLQCPICGIKLRATKPGIVVICKTCEVELIEY